MVDRIRHGSIVFIAKITEQVTALGQEDAARRLQSTTTTVRTITWSILIIVRSFSFRLLPQKLQLLVKLMPKML